MVAGAEDLSPELDASAWETLRSGFSVVLHRRPDETPEKTDARFVTVAALVPGSRSRIWEVIHDKEHAAEFIDGVLESRVIEREEHEILVEQVTRVGGPKGAYRYRLLHKLTPEKKAVFTYDGGELKDVIGAWWIFDGPDPGHFLVVYSLHIDAGFFAPQALVKAGMRKTMPRTIEAIAREVAKRGE